MLLEQLASKGLRARKKTANLSTNVRNDGAVVRSRKSPSPGRAQLKFEFTETTIGRAANGVYKRL